MIEKFSVSRDDGIYHAWPDLALTPSGKLICVFSECTSHGDRGYTRIVCVSSDDRGRTWTGKCAVSEAAHDRKAYWNCARVTQLKDGRLAIVADFIRESETSPVLENLTNHIWYSRDDGISWEGPFRMDGVLGIVPDKLAELENGSWIISAHNADGSTGIWTQRCWLSEDKGKRWKGPFVIAQSSKLKLCEGSIIEVFPDKLVCFMRENSGLGLPAYKAISEDGGRTWSRLYKYPIPGCHRPVAGKLKSGELLLTCRYCPEAAPFPLPGKRYQTTLAVIAGMESALAKTSKVALRIMPLDYDRAKVPDTGYTGWVQFPDGEIYVVNYITDDSPKGQIRGYSLSINDFYI